MKKIEKKCTHSTSVRKEVASLFKLYLFKDKQEKLYGMLFCRAEAKLPPIYEIIYILPHKALKYSFDSQILEHLMH